jgi:hypothetical protein
MIKSRRMRWEDHVEGTDVRCIHSFWLENLKKKGHLEDPSTGERIIF